MSSATASVESTLARLHQKGAADQLRRCGIALERILEPRSGGRIVARLLSMTTSEIGAGRGLDARRRRSRHGNEQNQQQTRQTPESETVDHRFVHLFLSTYLYPPLTYSDNWGRRHLPARPSRYSAPGP